MLRVRKTQLDSLKFQLSTLLKENKEKEKEEKEKEDKEKEEKKG